MAITEKNIMNRLYLMATAMLFFAVLIGGKLFNIQIIEGKTYKQLALSKTEKLFTIPPNRGNLYADDGSLLAASIPKYEIRFDAQTVSEQNFQTYMPALADSLAKLFHKSSAYYRQLFRKARANANRYKLIARNVDYLDYIRIKHLPLFQLGPYKGGFIETHRIVRDYPLGPLAARSIGYERLNESGYYTRVGLDGAFGATYLRGKPGKRLKQRIAQGQWKPIGLDNMVEPQDGLDVVSTIDINIQDIAHHELLAQLEKYKADHGSVVVMETTTGEIKAIANLGRTAAGKYYEKLNYALGESHEPGSTFKLMSLIAALEDKVIDTSTIVDTKKGRYRLYDRVVTDTKQGGYGKISVAQAFTRSSNTAFAKIIHQNYQHTPERFVHRLRNMHLHQPLGLPIVGEGKPIIRYPGDRGWSGISLAWMSHGYEVALTPLQTLTFYNAIANNGQLVKPRLIKTVKEGNHTVKTFSKQILNPSICSQQTVKEVQQLLKDVVEKTYGTGHDLYTKNFSMAGKTGTTQKNYVANDPDKLAYISSFAGYFPANSPKYSCIVVIHEPDKSVGYYGADVSGPVFKSMAQKIYTISPIIDEVKSEILTQEPLNKNYRAYYAKAQLNYRTVPKVAGMSGMDAVALLENLGLQVEAHGNGKVTHQSVAQGTDLTQVTKITLKLL